MLTEPDRTPMEKKDQEYWLGEKDTDQDCKRIECRMQNAEQDERGDLVGFIVTKWHTIVETSGLE